MAPLTQGTPVTFQHYGATKTGVVARTSQDGAIVWLTDGRWLHRVSVTPIG